VERHPVPEAACSQQEHPALHTDTVEDVLEPFIADGLVDSLLFPIKSGKEAHVYCCRAGDKVAADLVAIKIYKPRSTRSFRNDAVYQEGRVILDARARRAVARSTAYGQQVHSALWTNHEWEMLRLLHAAGGDVPKPISHSAEALLLEYIGGADAAAPLLKDHNLTPGEAGPLFERLLDNIQLFLEYNVVHGDLSPYNVLLLEGRPVVIDFPQAVDPRFNANAFELLRRDIQNLARYFQRAGVECDPFDLAERYWSTWERP
jgi:RIO kinase 1